VLTPTTILETTLFREVLLENVGPAEIACHNVEPPSAAALPCTVVVVAHPLGSAETVGTIIVMDTSEYNGVQPPCDIVHRNTATPAISPVTLDVGDEELAMVATPLTRDHAPVPTVGVFAASVTV
jgi:hypothetical protein